LIAGNGAHYALHVRDTQVAPALLADCWMGVVGAMLRRAAALARTRALFRVEDGSRAVIDAALLAPGSQALPAKAMATETAGDFIA
jgi:hypothetical protein